jgi:hypothetical protein
MRASLSNLTFSHYITFSSSVLVYSLMLLRSQSTPWTPPFTTQSSPQYWSALSLHTPLILLSPHLPQHSLLSRFPASTTSLPHNIIAIIQHYLIASTLKNPHIYNSQCYYFEDPKNIIIEFLYGSLYRLKSF